MYVIDAYNVLHVGLSGFKVWL